MRRLLLLVLLIGLPLAGIAAAEPIEQTITPLTPRVEQRVEPLTPQAEQRVEVIDADGVQGVVGDTAPSRAGRAAQVVSKVVVGVLAAAVSCAMMVASLLFI